MISIIITAWEEPNSLKECIRRILIQDIPDKFDIWVTCPDKETEQVVMDYRKKHSSIINFLHQPRELGKNIMLNILAKKAKGDILIFLDGDIFVSENSIKEIYEKFKDSKIGCVTGRPVSSNPRDNMLGYWSHLLTDAGAHNIRLEKYSKGEFLECSGYLFAVRKGVIGDIPLDVAEDAIIPLMFWEKNYKIAYAERALAYVTYPKIFRNWVSQKIRSSKAHEMMNKYVKGKKIINKSFVNEVIKGLKWGLGYPKNAKEFLWTLLLFRARLYSWGMYTYETKILNNLYSDKWKVAGSSIDQKTLDTRPLD